MTEGISEAEPAAHFVWSSRNVADYIGIDVQTVCEWLARGLLPTPGKLRGRRRWNGHVIKKWIPQEWLHLDARSIRARLEVTLAEKAILHRRRKKTRNYLQRIVQDFEKKMNQFYLKINQLERQIEDMKGGL